MVSLDFSTMNPVNNWPLSGEIETWVFSVIETRVSFRVEASTTLGGPAAGRKSGVEGAPCVLMPAYGKREVMNKWMRRIVGEAQSLLAGSVLVLMLLPPAGRAADSPAAKPAAIPWSQIGATATQPYSGDELGVGASAGCARLRCGFQRLEGEATGEGLWLTSMVTGQANDRFRLVAAAVGRAGAEGSPLPTEFWPSVARSAALPRTGAVEVAGQLVRFVRPGLTEEYSVSVDGVRQDFVVQEKPAGAGEGRLCLLLAVTGARVERVGQGTQLVLEKSGRKIAYSRLRVSDATGQELPAEMEVQRNSECRMQNPEFDLAVVVDDTRAAYPLRIDPTFSDANWISMGGSLNGANRAVHAAVADASGNLYIGGDFTEVGSAVASHIAKWDGSSWSGLGSGIEAVPGEYPILALAVSGSDLFACGNFTTAGGTAANNIAKWDGSSWSALGSGVNGTVAALAVSGSNLYAGGHFTIAGGKFSAYTARAVLGDPPGYSRLVGTRRSGGALQFSYVGYPATNYALDRTFNVSPLINWVSQATSSMTISGVLYFTNAPASGTNNFWRVRTVPRGESNLTGIQGQ
jgi:hypothetical protein